MENSNEDIDARLLLSSTSDSSEKSIKLKLDAQDDDGGSLEDLNLLDDSFKPINKRPHFLDYCLTNANVEFSDQTNQIIECKVPVPAEKPRKVQQTSNNNNSLGEFSGNCSNVVKQSTKIQSESKFFTTSGSGEKTTGSHLPTTDSVYSILTMLGSINSNEIATKFLEYSKNREMCVALRRSGCISLLVQIIHSDSSDDEVRNKVCQALHNIVQYCSDDKSGRREARVLKLIEQLFEYCDALRMIMANKLEDNIDRHPIQAIGTLMKISFDEEHRFCMTQLGALQTISRLIQLDYAIHGPVNNNDINCITLRRYAGMTLTNLTFGDCNNKAILCSNKSFMKALIDQINSNSDELVQVTASVIRNLSWRADTNMKEVLNEIGTVKVLTLAAMRCAQENTLKAILSALWNLSNHCAKNKAEFCELDGAIEFLIDMLSYEAPSKTMSVIENTGGILRNISSHIATKEELRVILRRKNCFSILLQQLKSPSLTVVSNACGTLGNLSAHCPEDQKFLRDNGAIPMLRSLIYSKHKMISTGSNIALRHLIGCRSSVTHNENMDSVAKMMDLKELPTLNVRKQRAMEHELDKNLAENYDTDDQISSPMSDKAGNDEKATSSSSKIYSKDETEINRDGMKATSKKKVQNIEDDDEEDEDAPVNFSAKYSNDGERGEYQETNLDQITDYSIRYAENQSESDEEVPKRDSAEDATRCYNTEDTPHTISHATSMTDLRGQSSKVKSEEKPPLKQKTPSEEKKEKLPQTYSTSGIQSPEKTVNYCEEGTPGFFSRNDSLSDLEESPDQSKKDKQSITNRNEKAKLANLKKEEEANNAEKIPQESTAATPKSVTFVNLADETPLMFSRTSSMGSLSSAEPACVDDKSSIVSDFSRLASGIISPSELPDSPTQSIPQSPSRHVHRVPKIETTAPLPSIPAVEVETITEPGTSAQGLQSIFEDNTNTFHIENTPALFSYATSLSNLSFDDEPKISTDALSKDFRLISHPSEDHEKEDDPQKPVVVKSEMQDDGNFGECSRVPQTDNVSDEESANDTFLLEDCINMGMNRNVKKSPVHEKKEPAPQKSPVNGNESSTSENDEQILEEVIREGMPKFPVKALKENPVDMMRSGAPLLPPYLPVVDETNRFIVEDSPCNFSVMSALSAITIESNMQPGPSKPKSPTNNIASTNDPKKLSEIPKAAPRLDKPRIPPEYDDSLSSLSIESEDDGNLLNMAISAGVNAKPKQKPPPTNPINIPIKKSENAANDSISSLESGDSKRDDQSNSILEQCIRSGIDNVVKKDSSKDNASGSRSFITSSPNKSVMPTFSKAPVPAPRKEKKNEMDKRDEELLMECINTGILKNTRTGYDPSTSGTYNQDMLIGMKKLTISGSENTSADPKNAETTPVIVKDQTAGVLISSQNLNNTITGVEVAVEKKMKMKIDSMFCNNSSINNENGIEKEIERENQEANGNSIAIRNEHSPLVNWMMLNGSNCSFDLNGSMSSFENMLERSNEYPAALLGASYDEDDSMNTMEISNEFMIDQREEYIRIDEKHKDPNLMLKSVDRLTQELVSTAEFLRKNSGINGEEMSSHSNTWNDENSFPSISMSAPMIASTNDDVTLASEQIFLEDKTPTNENSKIPNLFQPSADMFDGKSQQPNKKMFWSGNFGESKEFLESLGMSPKKDDMSRSYNRKLEEARKKMFYSSSLAEVGFLEEESPVTIKGSSKKPAETVWCEISSSNSGNYMENDASKKNMLWFGQQSTRINPDEPKSNQFWIDLDELPDVETQRRIMEEKRRESSGKNSLTWEISLDDESCSGKNGKVPKNRRSGDGAERSESPAKLRVSSRKSSGAGLILLNDENIEKSGESSPLSGRKSGGSGMSQSTAEKNRLAESSRNVGKQLKSGDFSPLFTRKSTENGSKKLQSTDFSKLSKVNGKKPEEFSQNSSRKSSTGNINLIHTEKPEISSEEDVPKVNINFKLGGEINFKLGGEVNNPTLNSFNYLNFGPTSIETCSTLSNSTIVTVEAQKMMLQNMDDSAHSLNLESVRPPSSMDCISMTSMQESTNGSPFHNRGAKKPLMPGLVAKRALGQQVFSSSIESVNSMNNIDNIRPPSIMDELLDSMISVDSIISEVVDPTLCADDIPGITNYETALSDVEDSLTLRSCQDLSKDETLTPVSSDFSSVESTPTKKKTPPNKKRHSERDRFKTYTINVDMILKEKQAKEKLSSPPRTNPRQRRQEDRKRFETQIIEHNLDSLSPVRLQRRQADPDRFKTHTIESPTLGTQDQEQDDLSIRAMTANFEFIRSEVAQSSSSSANTSNIRQKLNRIKTNNQNPEDSLEFEHQTSETESQRDLKYSLQYENIQPEPVAEAEEQKNTEPEKAKKEEKSKLAVASGKSKASNYISPYRMTTRVTPAAAKTKSNKVTKTPIIAKIVQRKSDSNAVESKGSSVIQKNNKVNTVTAKIPKPGFAKPAPKPKSAPSSTLDTPVTPTTPAIPLNRQGTFIKDEPTCENVPVVDNTPISPVKNMPVTKLKPPKAVSKYSSPADKKPDTSSPKKSSNLPSLKYRSNSNTSMKSSSSREKDLNNITPVRSNSGINLSNPKKNITSKIAGLWKNPEKKTISTSSSQLNGNGSAAKQPTAISQKKSFATFTKDKIKRSSTFNDIDKK